jgi:branched-chain amino acid transport system ATP-binding protein
MAAEPLLDLEEVRVRLGGETILAGVTLRIERGGLTALVGPNGAGKTTLFNAISGEVRPEGGRIRFKGRDITGLPPHRRARLGVGRAFQLTELFPTLSVFENIRLAVQAARGEAWHPFRPVPRFAQTRDETARLLEEVGLAPLAARPASTLGHGDQRRLDLAIALATAPDLLLLDEPLAALDPPTRRSLRAELAALGRALGLPALLVTHDLEEAAALTEEVSILGREGDILESGETRRVLTRPRRLATARLLDLPNLFEDGMVKGRTATGETVIVWRGHTLRAAPPPFPLAEGARIAWSVRGGAIRLLAAEEGVDNVLPATVSEVVVLPGLARLVVRLTGGAPLVFPAPAEGAPLPAPESAVRIGFSRQDVHLMAHEP